MDHCTYNTDCAGCVTWGPSLLRVRGVTMTYGDQVVLRDVNLDVCDVDRRCHVQGQVVGILGGSGVGKSQLLRIISGLQQPTSGEVLVGNPLTPVRAGLVGVIAQGYPLFRNRTVLGNLMLAATKKYRSTVEAKAQCLEMLNQFGIDNRADAYPAQLSGGQRQRVAIAQQLLSSDHFILMDEPTASLDLVRKEELAKTIDRVACMDTLNTIVIVSHDVDWLASIADHLYLLGPDRNPDGSVRMTGARIQEEYNLVDLGLCWQENILTRPDFVAFTAQVKARFRRL